MEIWSKCDICGRDIPVGELCYGLKKGNCICKNCCTGFENCTFTFAPMPTLTPPNEPLSIEQLREMDGEPVWVVYDQDAAKTTPGFDPLTLWALVEVTKDSVLLTNNLGGRTAYADNQDLEWEGITVYRRQPEGET